MNNTVRVHEIYLSIQGESTLAGLPCIFIRLTGCDLRCSYCDTAYAFKGGRSMERRAVLEEVHAMAAPFAGRSWRGHPLPLVEVTGGEPLLQKGTSPLLEELCEEGYTVLLETSGAHPIQALDPRVRRIMDLKCPSSGESGRMHWENIECLTERDEVKCVIATREDYEWCREQVRRWKLEERCEILISWCAPLTDSQRDSSLKPIPSGHEPITRQTLIERMLADGLPARFQSQLHKIVWPADAVGV